MHAQCRLMNCGYTEHGAQFISVIRLVAPKDFRFLSSVEGPVRIDVEFNENEEKWNFYE